MPTILWYRTNVPVNFLRFGFPFYAATPGPQLAAVDEIDLGCDPWNKDKFWVYHFHV